MFSRLPHSLNTGAGAPSPSTRSSRLIRFATAKGKGPARGGGRRREDAAPLFEPLTGRRAPGAAEPPAVPSRAEDDDEFGDAVLQALQNLQKGSGSKSRDRKGECRCRARYTPARPEA